MPKIPKRECLREIYENLKAAVNRGDIKTGDIPIAFIYFGDDADLQFQNALAYLSERRRVIYRGYETTVSDVVNDPGLLDRARQFGKKGKRLFYEVLKNDFGLDIPKSQKRASESYRGQSKGI
jgi:hypothetical protein